MLFVTKLLLMLFSCYRHLQGAILFGGAQSLSPDELLDLGLKLQVLSDEIEVSILSVSSLFYPLP